MSVTQLRLKIPFPMSSLTSSVREVCCGGLEGDFGDEGGGGFFFRPWTFGRNFGGLGEGEVGRGRVEDVFVDFRPLIDMFRLFVGDQTGGELRREGVLP